MYMIDIATCQTAKVHSVYTVCTCNVITVLLSIHQVVDLQQLTAHKSDTDDQILSLVNAKSVEWEGLLANKDTELIDCHKQIQQLHQQLTAASMDTDKASVIKLSHVRLLMCVVYITCVCLCLCVHVC